MDIGWLDISRKEEEEKRMVSALYHVISGGDDDNVDAQIEPQSRHHHQHYPVEALGGPPQVPLVFRSGEGSSSTNNNRVKKKKVKTGKEYRGVRRRGNKWVAEIWDPHHGRVQWLSSFPTAEEAARAYDRKAIEYRGVAGAFPYMNFPLEDYDYNFGTNNNVQTTITQMIAGPRQSSSTSAGTNESAPSHSSTTNINNNDNSTAAGEDDPLLLLDEFDDYTLQQFMDLANSL